MVQVDNCCCCFNVKTGANIIGALFILDLISEFWHPTINIARWGLKLICAGIYLTMVMRDTRATRMLFFFMYIASLILKPVTNSLTGDSDDPESEKAWQNLSLDKIAKQSCENMSQQDRQNMQYTNMEECQAGMKTIIWRSIVIITIAAAVIALSITIHFCLVLYTHWQNSSLSKDEGGTGEDAHQLSDEQ